jgi:hypothetical protein
MNCPQICSVEQEKTVLQTLEIEKSVTVENRIQWKIDGIFIFYR